MQAPELKGCFPNQDIPVPDFGHAGSNSDSTPAPRHLDERTATLRLSAAMEAGATPTVDLTDAP